MESNETHHRSVAGESSPDSLSKHAAELTDEGNDHRLTHAPTDDPLPGECRLPTDEIFGILSTERRRRILEYMAETGPETTLADLADVIAAAENDTEVRLVSSQERKRVYVALYQTHLPRMDAADVIDFDSSRGTV